MKPTAIGGTEDWSRRLQIAAALVGLGLAVGLLRGKDWTKAHSALAGTATVLYLLSL